MGSCLVLVLLDVKLFRRPMCILPAVVLFHCQRGVPCILPLLGRDLFPWLASLCSFLLFVTLRTMVDTDPRPVALQATSLDNILMFMCYHKRIVQVYNSCHFGVSGAYHVCRPVTCVTHGSPGFHMALVHPHHCHVDHCMDCERGRQQQGKP